MLRFILKRRIIRDGVVFELFSTIDFDVPELQTRLMSGGYGESGSDDTALAGVEVLTESDEWVGK